MGKVAILIVLAACGLSVNAHAQNLLAYWNMDASTVSSKFTANQGDQAGTVTMTAAPSGFLNGMSSVTGIALNALPPIGDPNNALHTTTFISSGEECQVVMSGLNLSNMTDLTLSFAVKSNAFFSWGEHMHIDYDIGEGWVDWVESGSTEAGQWEVDSFTLPEAVNGQSSVSLRIRMTDFIAVAQYVDFDNIQITAVPEPGTWALLGGLGIAGLVIIRRRRA
ncbi:MAG: PEP-CTERM sorting domain-containing protein [Verrucomicrobiota bacterium JB024]|nr:PEP-CTERM sorting domain-containing protein [Verrucomicrobiota bacterium JB024]